MKAFLSVVSLLMVLIGTGWLFFPATMLSLGRRDEASA
jgi:hypothetical protein